LKIFGYLKEIFKLKKFESTLEIGCGIGIISEFIRKFVPNTHGIDLSEKNIKFAKSTVKNVQFECVDFLDLNSEIKFELITLFDVLEHFPKHTYSQVFEKIRDLSNKETLIAITIPDPDFLSYIKENHPAKLQVIDESIYFDELKSLLDNFNLEIMKYEKYGIDYDNQYRFYLLNYRKEKFSLEKKLILQRITIRQLFEKTTRRIRTILRKVKYRKFLKR